MCSQSGGWILKLCLLLHFSGVWYLLELQHSHRPEQLQTCFFFSLSFFPHRLDKRRRRAVLTARVFPAAESFTVHHSAISHYTTLWFAIICVLKCPREGLLPLCQPPSRHEIRKQPVGEDILSQS